jgi:hypothetical protein
MSFLLYEKINLMQPGSNLDNDSFCLYSYHKRSKKVEKTMTDLPEV